MGFIGSHLCEKLKKNNSVWSLDNYFSGTIDNHVNGVSYNEGHTKDITKIFSNQVFDFIFHLGEYSRVEQSFEDYDLVVESNLNAMSTLLQFAKRMDCKFIYSGSSTKFGDIGVNSLVPILGVRA